MFKDKRIDDLTTRIDCLEHECRILKYKIEEAKIFREGSSIVHRCSWDWENPFRYETVSENKISIMEVLEAILEKLNAKLVYKKGTESKYILEDKENYEEKKSKKRR